MSSLLDLRPPALNVAFRPGNTLTVELTWPTGYLADRTYTAGIGDQTPDLDIAGDVMTLALSGAQTTALAGEDHTAFILTETTGGLADAVIIGSWSPSMRANLVVGATITVNTSTGAVTVTGAGGGAASRVGRVVEHIWSQDGWTPFDTVVATADGTQAFDLTVTGGAGVEPRGRFTSQAGSGDGNLRNWYLREGTNWEDSETVSVFHRPSAWGSSPTNRPQMGHVHRAQEVEPGIWHAWVAWYDIAFGTSGLLVNTWRVDGVTLTQGAGKTDTNTNGVDPDIDPGTSAVDRAIGTVAADRVGAFNVAQHVTVVQDPRQHGYVAGDIVNITSGQITELNGNDLEVLTVGSSLVQIVDTTGVDIARAANAAFITPAGVNNRYFPRRFATRLVGDVLMAKHWRLTDPEPEWDNLDAGIHILTPPTSPPLPTGRGLSGILAGHAHTGAWGEFGDITFREVIAA